VLENKYNLEEKLQKIIPKDLRGFITVKDHCSTTLLKQQKSFVSSIIVSQKHVTRLSMIR